MLEVLINFICAFLLALTGFFVVKKIIISDVQLNKRNITIIVCNSIMIVISHYMNSNSFTALINFIINTMTYQLIFNNTLDEAVVETGLLFILMIVADITTVLIETATIPQSVLNNNSNIYLYLLSNIIVSIIVLIIINIKLIRKKLNNYFNVLVQKNLKLNVIFIFLVMIATSGVYYSIIINYKLSMRLISDTIVIVALLAIVIIFMNHRSTYNKLSDEYDILLSNVENFEEWIEKEQFTRHEYKNQLAALYAISNEQKVKSKIEEIINQNLNIEGEFVNSLRDLPKGGLKGLLYYKTIIAKKNKVKITIDTSISKNSILHKLGKKKTNELSKIVGIFFDNAIEAASKSRKKILLLEIYELNNSVNIVISNTYPSKSVIKNNSDKGVSSKGKGRGNGLYFAKKIIQDNKWLEVKQEIIDKYYIETINIKNTPKK